MKLSIVIPVYNEEKTIDEVIRRVQDVDLGGIKKEIIIVDDFSTDRTRAILKKIKDKDIRVFYNEKNRGKGASVREGFSRATGDFIIIQDADMEYDLNDYHKLLQPLLQGKADVVYGSRFMAKHKARYRLYYLGNLLISLVASVLFMKRITDVETCYKVFRKDVIKSLGLKANRFELEPEITAKVVKKGYNIIEVPIHYKCRSFDEGKKISWRDGVKAIYYLLKYRFVD
ncbi:glycosyl transferase [Candidatus Woesearchaeota archaeon CG10_big_fil_rev_8_21_14_0_10_44_13]|nr:MAG: glycosyl transferase [Candidatus Woesearchaeota archaeon CG10_big_fil_rev_8_21_14_0_10_44_13]